MIYFEEKLIIVNFWAHICQCLLLKLSGFMQNNGVTVVHMFSWLLYPQPEVKMRVISFKTLMWHAINIWHIWQPRFGGRYSVFFSFRVVFYRVVADLLTWTGVILSNSNVSRVFNTFLDSGVLSLSQDWSIITFCN